MNSNKKYNYKAEKTVYQRMLRAIKRKTRHISPLKGMKCQYCNSKAQCHHHIKNYKGDINSETFVFLCTTCHMIAHGWDN
jgi:hypothetical protein